MESTANDLSVETVARQDKLTFAFLTFVGNAMQSNSYPASANIQTRPSTQWCLSSLLASFTVACNPHSIPAE